VKEEEGGAKFTVQTGPQKGEEDDSRLVATTGFEGKVNSSSGAGRRTRGKFKGKAHLFFSQNGTISDILLSGKKRRHSISTGSEKGIRQCLLRPAELAFVNKKRGGSTARGGGLGRCRNLDVPGGLPSK